MLILSHPEQPVFRKNTIHPLIEVTYSSSGTQDIESGERRFVIVIPANNPGPDLCKLLTSAIALGYPTPIIVNWEKVFDKSVGGKWSPFLGKITGTLDYMERVTHPNAKPSIKLHNDDLVLILDAYDVWFQLPPDVLLRRYHESIRRGNERLRQEWDGEDEMPMKQTIMVSAQKRCYPTIKEGIDMHCEAIPQSDLSPDLYGPKTDTAGHYNHNYRPRYLNSGSFLGPLGDMKQYFRRVKERMDRQVAEDRPFEGDQGVFGELFGEQEVWRTWRREHKAFSASNFSSSPGEALSQKEFELHIGLDYAQTLFLPTVYEENDGDFVSLNNQSMVDSYSSKQGVSPSRILGIPKDLRESQNPLANALPKQFPDNTGWEEMPLYADFFTTAVPVILHHNAWKHGVKSRRSKWWDRTWYFPYLRELMESHLEPQEVKPLAKIPARGGHLTYLPPKFDNTKKEPRIFDLDRFENGLGQAEFDTVCRYDNEDDESEKRWYDEVFRDGKGSI